MDVRIKKILVRKVGRQNTKTGHEEHNGGKLSGMKGTKEGVEPSHGFRVSPGDMRSWFEKLREVGYGSLAA
jgi:hypothetical protein